jgi:hypothetical protein
MGQIREVDAISDAIIETEKEIAGAAWDQEDTERDDSGRSLEDMGDGLEGQHEADDEETEGEDADGEAESEGEGEGEAETAEQIAAKAKPGETEKPPERPEGRVPSGKLREANERARALEAERDALKAQVDKSKGDTQLSDRLDQAMREIAALKTAPRPPAAEPPKPEVIPDIFEDPKGFAEHLTKGFQTELSKRDAQLANQRVETSMAIAHAIHKDTFEKAFESINKLNVQNPDDRMAVQRIYNSPNPGEALVAWHKRNETLSLVGDDPAAYRERVAKETREDLMKDPEFRKQLIAELRGEAAKPGPDGNPRTITRLPKSLNGAAGSNLGADRGDPSQFDDSEQAVADAAWR